MAKAPTGLQLEHQEAAGSRIATIDDLVPAIRGAGDLQIYLLLIGSHPRHLAIGIRAAGHDLRHGDRLILRVLPRLEQKRTSKGRIEVLRHISSRKN
jgi:hypothetical protein